MVYASFVKSTYSDGFTVDVTPIIQKDSEHHPILKLPLKVHITLASNPKKIENTPNLDSEMEGIIKKDGTTEEKNFHLL